MGIMEKYTYYKGWRKYPELGHTENCVFRVLENPTVADKHNVHIMDLGSPNWTCGGYDSIEELEKEDKYYMACEITKKEYHVYEELKVIIQQLFLSGIACGNYPNINEIRKAIKELSNSTEQAYLKINKRYK